MTSPHDPVAARVTLRAQFLDQRAAAVTSALLRGLAGTRPLAAFVPDEHEPGAGRLPAGSACWSRSVRGWERMQEAQMVLAWETVDALDARGAQRVREG